MSVPGNRLHRSRAAALPFALIALAAAGCGGSPRATGGLTAAASPAAAWHQVVLCARAHGMPGLPEPQINPDGKATFPNGLNVPPETHKACQTLLDRLVPNSQNQAPGAAQLAALLRFARCMRSHGIADWPDPRPDGSFVPDARIASALKTTFRSQLLACDHLNPDPHGRVYFSHP